MIPFRPAIFLLLCAPLAAAAIQQDGLAPGQRTQRIWVERTRADMGSVYRGEIASHTYKIENRGDATLNLSRVKMHCNCISSAMLIGSPAERIEIGSFGTFPPETKVRLEPGQTMDLIVMVDTTGMPERTLSKSVDVFSDDPVKPDLPLYFDFTVKFPIETEPRRLEFGDLEMGVEQSLSSTLTLLPGVDLNFTGTKRQRRLKTALKRISAEGEPGIWELTVTVHREMSPGTFATVVGVLTDHPRITSVPVIVTGKLHSTISFEPGKNFLSMLEFGRVRADAGAVRSIKIQNTRPEVPYRIERVEIEGQLAEQVETRLQVVEEGVAYVIEVTLPPGLEPGSFDGHVLVYSDHPTDGTRRVRFRGQIE